MLLELNEPTRSDEEVARFIGKGIGVLVERALNEGRRPHDEAECAHALASFKRHYAAVNGAQAMLYPFVRATLSVLHERGIRCACVTNKASEFTLPLLAGLGIAHFFSVVVSGDTVLQKKPEPEPLLHACEALGVSPAHVLMVGDSANDALAGRRAGIPVLLVRYGYSEGEAVDSIDCDGLLSSFAALLSFVSHEGIS
ncbi:MAG: Phosphoglycolate phosphatase [Rhodocyclales bacterium]|nr:Phosphoglycolate phosphatase [Rhodocyclales bacterium]